MYVNTDQNNSNTAVIDTNKHNQATKTSGDDAF